MPKLGFVQLFAVRSLVIVVIMAAVLGVAVSVSVERVIIDAAADKAQSAARAVISRVVSAMDLSSPLSTADRATIDTIVRDQLLGEGVGAVKVWNADGILVYSTDSGDPVGRSFADEEDIQGALAGETVSEIVRTGGVENENQFADMGSLIEIYAPLMIEGSDEPVGVFEVYQPYAPILAKIRSVNILIWGIVLAGSMGVYVMQVTMVRNAAERLCATEAQVDTLNLRLEGSLRELEEHSIGTLQALITAVDAKDHYTASHSLSVTDYATIIGKRMALSEEELRLLERAGLLHDIGKIGISEQVLLKPSQLTDDEYEEVKEHSEIGAHIIESVPSLQDLCVLVRHHHERWDGGGYPDRLEGERIPLLARVLAVADAFDAMTSDRPYREGLRVALARQELIRFRGLQFDPRVVDALLAAMDAGDIEVGHWHTRGSRLAVASA